MKKPRIADGFPGERLKILPPSVVQRALTLPFCRDFCVTHTGLFDRVAGHFVDRPAGSPQHILIVCINGAGHGRVGGSTWQLRRGHGVLLPPGVAHQYAASDANPWTLFWFHFTGGQATQSEEALGVGERSRRFWIHDVDLLVEAFEECYRYAVGGFSDNDLIGLGTAFVRLLGLCRTLQRSPDMRRRRTEDLVLRSIRFMRENLGRPLMLAEIARHSGLSVPHFSAMFKKQMNCSPIQLLTRLKLQHACQCLETTDASIAEVAFSLGFDDPFYFSRNFTQHIGCTPTDYRRQTAQGRLRTLPKAAAELRRSLGLSGTIR